MIWRCRRAAAPGGGRHGGAGRGFTLVEVLVVLAIMAFLAAVFMPLGARQRRHAELANDARRIAEALRLTRSRAILGNRALAFQVDVRHALYRAGGAPVALPNGIHLALTTAQDETLNRAVGAIRFFPDGSSTGGGIALSSASGRYDVSVDWLTGAVTVHEQALHR